MIASVPVIRSVAAALLVVAHIHGAAQYQFERTQLNQGHINHIMRDSEGYIWVSTQDGLTKYSGDLTQTFNYNHKDRSSIPNNYVWLTFEDSHGHIWVGTFGGGLCRYDKHHKTFTTYPHPREVTIGPEGGPSSIRTLDQYDNDYLLVGTDNGLYLFDIKNEQYVDDPHFKRIQEEAGFFHNHFMQRFNSTVVLIGGENGGYKVDLKEKTVDKLSIPGIESARIKAIVTHQEDLLISTDASVYRVKWDKGGDTYQVLQHYHLSDNLGSTVIKVISDQVIMVGAATGLYSIDLHTDEITRYSTHEDSPQAQLKDRIIYTIAEVEPELFWIGTKTSIYSFATRPARFLQVESQNICETAVLGMMEDKDHNLWMGTRNGLARIKNFHLPQSEWTYYCYNSTNTPELRNNYILNVMYLDGGLWLGYRRMGLTRFTVDDNDQLQIIPAPHRLDSLTRNHSVCEITKDDRGSMWIGTSGNGLIIWHPENETFTHMTREQGTTDTSQLVHNFIFAIEQIDEGTMTLGTPGGISEVDIDDYSISNYIHEKGDSTSLSGNFVMDFHRDNNENIWVCTSYGVNLWLPDKSFRSWTRNDGLPNDVIYGMESYNDELWVSSNYGISHIRMQPDNDLSFDNFDEEDGIQGDEFNQFSFYQSSSKHILFGGGNGVTYFDPRHVEKNTTPAPTVIEGFYLFNQPADHTLDRAIEYADELRLDYDQNFVSFDIAALSYRAPHQNQYRYRMVGLNDQWMDLGTRNYLSFNGLPAGQYQLQMMSANNDNIWSDKIKKLDIIVSPPIWNTWWAWLAYLVLATSAIITFFRMRLSSFRKIQQAKEEERQKIREQSARDFHDEAGTTITKLSLQIQYLRMQTKDSSLSSALDQIETNVQQLRSGMRDFIWVLDPSKDSLAITLQRIKRIGLDLFEHSATQFTMRHHLDADTSSLNLSSHLRRQLIMITKEALNNVVRHAGAKRCILEVQTVGVDDLLITIKDDGSGWEEGLSRSGNGLDNMRQRAAKIGGTIAFENNDLGGATVRCSIPITSLD